MSGILKRRIFITDRPVTLGEKQGKSVKRFTDFAIVTTGIGSMVEPFLPNDVQAMNGTFPSEFDPTDMMRRIDEIGSSSPSGECTLVRDQDTVLHSFNHWLREGP